MRGLYQVARDIVEELSVQLELTRAGAVKYATVHPGDMVPQYGCNSAYVRIGQQFKTTFFPAQQVEFTKGCVVENAAILELIVDRCYPATEKNEMPSVGRLDSAARDALEDADAMRRAVACAMGKDRHVVGGWNPRGPQGLMHGGVLSVTVLLPADCSCAGEFPQIDAIVPPLPGDPRS